MGRFAKLITQELTGGTLSAEAAARVSWIKTSFVVGAVIGSVLTLFEQKTEWRRFVPSPTGMGIAALIPINAVTMIFVGALGDLIWQRVARESHDRYSIPIASGLIAGEALVAVALPLLVTLGLMQLP